MTHVGELDPLLKREGFIRTELECHGCREQNPPLHDRFIATINYSLNGNHKIECPRCGHIHYRVIVDGRVTSERFSSGYPTHTVERRNMWKSETVPIVASTTSAFIRDLWLQRGLDD